MVQSVKQRVRQDPGMPAERKTVCNAWKTARARLSRRPVQDEQVLCVGGGRRYPRMAVA